MGRPLHRHAPSAAAALLLATGLAGGVARADVNVYVLPSYTNTSIDTTDATGRTTHLHDSSLTQSYRLSLDQTILPLLSVSGGGNFEKTNSVTDVNGVRTESDNWTWGAFGALRFGTRILGGGANYNYSEQKPLTPGAGSQVNETASAYANWRPEGFPQLSLKLTRSDVYEKLHPEQETVTKEVLGNAIYQGIAHLDLNYTARYANVLSHAQGYETAELDNSLRVSYGNSFFDGWTSVSGNYLVTNTLTDTTLSGAGGTVQTQQLPIAGLSLVEAFPALPGADTLVANPALIDGDTATAAGLDIGFAPALAGDNAFRDAGVQFADPQTKVNTVFIWVDRYLPPAIAAAFTWEFYKSDDNVTWTPVATAGLPQFAVFQNRFEVAIDLTAARYVKAVAKPLLPSVTTDRRYADVFVTELQLLLAVPAETLKGSRMTTSNRVNASLRQRLLREANLYYDLSLFLSHQAPENAISWSVANGLSYDRKLGRVLALTARLSRSDADSGTGHVASNQLSAALSARPLPTLTHNLTYTGQLTQVTGGTSIQNTIGLYNRAELYRGVGAVANVGFNLGRSLTGQRTSGGTANLQLALAPHPSLSLATTYAFTSATASGGGQPETTTTFSRLDASASFRPLESIYLTASVARIFSAGARTLTNLGASYSPLAGGDLQVQFNWAESYDSSNDGVSRLITPSLRWTITRWWSLDASYGVGDTSSVTGKSRSRILFASMTITL